ncbi:UAP56-interacting factor-like isoform X4 [Lissotriton helveticus]
MEQSDGESAARKMIDMSLDDIIQLHKEEQSDSLPDLNTEQQKNIKQYMFGNQENQFQPSLQGVGRLRRGFKPEFSGMKWKTIRTAGLSPLNRQGGWSMQIVKVNSWQEKINRRRLQQKRAFRSPGIRTGLYKSIRAETKGPSLQPFHKIQRRSTFNLGRMQTFNNRVKTTKTQRRQAVPVFGSVLTVSVPNPKAGQTKAYVRKRPQAVGIKGAIQSKGVPLSFSVGSVANQTNYTLHERFSTLKTRRPFTTMTTHGRTVTLV